MARMEIRGNLTDTPRFAQTAQGREYASFTVAEDERRLNYATRQWETVGTDFFHVQAFTDAARDMARRLHKGQLVRVAAQAQIRDRQLDSGEVVEQVYIRANAIEEIRLERSAPQPASPGAAETASPAPAPSVDSGDVDPMRGEFVGDGIPRTAGGHPYEPLGAYPQPPVSHPALGGEDGGGLEVA